MNAPEDTMRQTEHEKFVERLRHLSDETLEVLDDLHFHEYTDAYGDEIETNDILGSHHADHDTWDTMIGQRYRAILQEWNRRHPESFHIPMPGDWARLNGRLGTTGASLSSPNSGSV